jgi:hypothetical protein
MFIVICTDTKILDMSKFQGYKWSNLLFGPFTSKYDAEEWVDNHCGKKYWSIVKLNDTTP